MAESESKKDKVDKKQRRFSQEQYEMLKRCSDKRDMTEWNNWRQKNKNEHIYLEGANFNKFSLEGVRLDEDPIHIFGTVYLEGAQFRLAKLKNARFVRAHLEKTDFYYADLQAARMNFAHLEGAESSHSDLRGAQLPFCTVDGSTMFLYCKINQHTWFYGVGLDAVRIDPATKQLLEYNIRRKNWQKWYWVQPDEKIWWLDTPRKKQLRVIRAIPRLVFTFPVRWFWWVSNYGISGPRIIKVFLVLAVAFASVYYLWGMIAPPGVLDYLFVDANGVKVASRLVPIRAIHFSVVVMTVGFTNMHANAHSFWAHILVSLQMILGFVLLGALVTRFAVLFTAGGPAGKFADEKDKATEDRGQRTEDRGQRTEDGRRR